MTENNLFIRERLKNRTKPHNTTLHLSATQLMTQYNKNLNTTDILLQHTPHHTPHNIQDTEPLHTTQQNKQHTTQHIKQHHQFHQIPKHTTHRETIHAQHTTHHARQYTHNTTHTTPSTALPSSVGHEKSTVDHAFQFNSVVLITLPNTCRRGTKL